MKNKETLEEAAERNYNEAGVNAYFNNGFIRGAKWQAEIMYSEDEVLEILNTFNKQTLQLQKLKLGNSFNVKEWFEKFKKK